MGSLEIFLLVVLLEHLLIIVFFHKQILQGFKPSNFFIIGVQFKTGELRDYYVFKSKIKDSKVKINEVDRFILPTEEYKKGSRYLEFDENSSIPKKHKKDIEKSLDLLLQDKELKAWSIFKEPLNRLEKIMQLLLPAIVGLVIGALAMTIHWQNQCQIMTKAGGG